MVLFLYSVFRKTLSQMLEITEGSVMPAAAASGQKPNCVHVEQAVLPPKDSPSDDSLDAQCALHAQYVLQLLQLQRRAEFLCDITIHVRDRSFKAHKPLLAACSLYFRRLFADAESKESTALNLTALTPNGFQVLLDYIYSGSLAITAENSSEVLSAATCLQMTNVVETCLNFMRSSFRMTKNNDLAIPSTTTQNSNSLRGAAIPGYPIGKHSSKYKAPTDAFGRKKLNAKMATSRPVSQDNLQILSTESINETEFKNMVVDAQDKPPLLISQSGNLASLATRGHLPSASQLQSVLPILMTNHPRQPTLTEVQRILTSRPSDRHPTSGTSASQINFSALNLTTSACYKSPDPHISPPEHGKMVAATSLSDTSPSTSSFGVNCQSQNGPTSMSAVASNDNSAMDFSTISSAARSSITPERNSGDAQTGNTPSDNKKFEKLSLRRNEQISSPERYSSDEQGNSVEISSEEESECDVWSAGRSVISSSDLSGTPFPAITPTVTHPSPKSKFSALRLHTNPRYERSHKLDANEGKAVSKALSLPSLPGKLPMGSNLTRTHSMGEGSAPVITYEKAASAMAALAYSPSDSLETHSSNQSEDNKIIEAQKILSQAVHKNVLPLKPSSEDRSLSLTVENVHQNELTSPVDHDFEQTPDLIKVEHHSDVEEGQSGFPVSKEFPKSRASMSRALESGPDAVKPQYLLEEHADSGAEDEDFALDLSIQHHSNRRRSSSIQFDEQSPQYPPFVQNYDSDAIEKRSSSRHPSTASSLSDPGMQLAVDALSMLRQSQQKGTKSGWSQGVAEQPHTPTKINVQLPLMKDSVSQDSLRSSQSIDGASLKQTTAMFSRKPRRTTGGQTCTWPGCGRLFRHRNIYEEHQRLHELGIPVSQLRKCYMGARVKKTVREQLEELRTSDNVFEGNADAVKHSRVRKRKSTSDNQEPVRKRVTVKDRPGAFALFGQPSTSKSSPPTPPRIRQSLSHPATGQSVSQFQQPPTSISNYLGPRFIQVMGADGVVRLAQTAEPSSATSSQNIPSSQPVTLSQQALQQTVIGFMPPPLVSSVQAAVSGSQPQTINPVEATLALLGIRTPARRSSASSSAYPMPSPLCTLSTDQMRRRLAVRETTGVGSSPAQDTSVLVSATTSTNPVIVRGTVAPPGVFTLSEMYPAPPRSSGGAAPQPRSSHNRSPTPPS